jgi:hypothetical protein
MSWLRFVNQQQRRSYLGTFRIIVFSVVACISVEGAWKVGRKFLTMDSEWTSVFSQDGKQEWPEMLAKHDILIRLYRSYHPKLVFHKGGEEEEEGRKKQNV